MRVAALAFTVKFLLVLSLKTSAYDYTQPLHLRTNITTLNFVQYKGLR
jgi:hypothetical protein